eukprot:EST47698.1 Transmembrane amino acid transporter protein [Spironucleus salmonicida]
MIVMICSYPLLCFCFRECLEHMIYGVNPRTYRLNATFAICTSLTVGLIASFLTEIILILDMVSALAGVPLVIIFPGLLGLRSGIESSSRLQRILYICFNSAYVAMGVVLVFIGVVTTLLTL